MGRLRRNKYIIMLMESLKNFWSNPKNRTIVKLLIVASLLALVVYTYATYTIVRVTVSTTNTEINLKDLKIRGYNGHALNNTAQQPHEVTKDSIQIIPRAVDYFEAATPVSETIHAADTSTYSWWPYNEIKIELQPQKYLQKVSTSGGACPVSVENDEIYSYRCSNPQTIFHQNTNTSPWDIESTASMPDLQSVSPYKYGLIGLQSSGTLRLAEPLVFINPTDGSRVYRPLPSELSGESVAMGSITTDSTDQTSPYVVFTSHTAKSFFVVDAETSSVIATIPYPKDSFTKSSNISCHIVDRNASCYIGRYTDSPEHAAGLEDEHKHGAEPPEKSYITSFGVDNKNPRVDTFEVHDGHIKTIVRDKEGNVYATDAWDNLVHIKKDGSQQLIARQIDQLNYVDKVVFTKDSSLYTYDTKANTSVLVYKDSGLNISSVSSHGKQLVSMFATDGVSTSDDLYIFKLNDEEYLLSKGERTSKLLSLYGDSDVTSVDYNGSTAQIVLNVPIVSNRQTGTTTPLQPQFDDAKKRVENKIRALGVGNIKINYLP